MQRRLRRKNSEKDDKDVKHFPVKELTLRKIIFKSGQMQKNMRSTSSLSNAGVVMQVTCYNMTRQAMIQTHNYVW